MADLEDVVAALVRSVTMHNNAQPEDVQLIVGWLDEKREADEDDAKQDGKTFKPTGKK